MRALDKNLLRLGPGFMLAVCLAFGPAPWLQDAHPQDAYRGDQGDAHPQRADASNTASANEPPAQSAFSQQQLDQMLAPIALYPDPLLSQILMASTYPLEVVEAARWSRANPGLRGDEAVRAVQQRDWDPSVKSLVAFPRILQMMDEKLEWAENLGDAFLAQQAQVMDTVQNLRQKAYAAGNLKSNEQVRVETEGQIIVVTPANPDVVYVPYYDPAIVYGGWWWPDYPPVYWAPWPGYFVVSGFAWGTGTFVTTGFFFGGCDWRLRRVNIVNVNNYYYPRITPEGHPLPRPVNAVPGPWQHDPGHRRGIPYRDIPSRNRYMHPEGSLESRRSSPRYDHPSFTAPPGEASRPAISPGAGADQGRPATPIRPETRRRRAHGQPDGGTQPSQGIQPRPGPQPTPQVRPDTETPRPFEARPRPDSQPRPDTGAGTQPRRHFERRSPGSDAAPRAVTPPVQEHPGRGQGESSSRPRGGGSAEGTSRGQRRTPDERRRDNTPGGGEDGHAR